MPEEPDGLARLFADDPSSRIATMVDVRDEELLITQRINTRIAELELQIGICQDFQVLRTDQRFMAFVKGVARLRNLALGSLVVSVDPYRTSRLQGQVQAYDRILRIVEEHEERRKTLAAELATAQNRAKDLGLIDGRVNPAAAIWQVPQARENKS